MSTWNSKREKFPPTQKDVKTVEIDEKSSIKNESTIDFGKRKNRDTRKRLRKMSISGPKLESKSIRRMEKYVYSAGDIYSSQTHCHRTCVEPTPRTPTNMGWLWNVATGPHKPRPGWKPGAISPSVRNIMQETKSAFLKKHTKKTKSTPLRGLRKTFGEKSRTYLETTRSRNYQIQKKLGSNKEELEEEPETWERSPTLRVIRRKGNMYISMVPVNQENDNKVDDPGEKPVKIKIPKKMMAGSSNSSSTASDLELEFTPPAGLHRNLKKPDVIHADTQVWSREFKDVVKPVVGKKKSRKKRK